MKIEFLQMAMKSRQKRAEENTQRDICHSIIQVSLRDNLQITCQFIIPCFSSVDFRFLKFLHVLHTR